MSRDLQFDFKNRNLIQWNGRVVMSRSERPFLEQLFKSVSAYSTNRVLEIGFGLGISAKLIQRYLRPKKHHIVEIHREIFLDLRKFSESRSGVAGYHADFWFFRSKTKYDFVFFDPFDYHEEEEAFYPTRDDDDRYDRDKAARLIELLAPGGIVCCPHFGSGPFEKMPGFSCVRKVRMRVDPFMLESGRTTRHAGFSCWHVEGNSSQESSGGRYET